MVQGVFVNVDWNSDMLNKISIRQELGKGKSMVIRGGVDIIIKSPVMRNG